MPQKINKLVWLDLEMTGLELDEHVIMEISILITDPKLNILDEKGFSTVVGITEDRVENMDPHAHKMHIENGLLEKSLSSKVTEADAEQMALEYLKKYVEEDEAPLCGNTISTDRMFLKQRMKELNAFLHYRNISVTTIKQIIQIHHPEVRYQKSETHRAMDDIRESIKQMKFYTDYLFEK